MPEKEIKYLTTLTPLRGIAALLVVIFHCNLALATWLHEGYTNFVTNGWLWVDFFFVLSGFIMSYVYSKYFSEKCTWKDYKKFIGARFARIYPLHFITTIWAFIMCSIIFFKASGLDPFFAVMFNPKSLPECLLLIQSLHIYRTPPLNTPSWSLSTEWWVYVIFPFIVPLFAKLKQLTTVLIFLFIAGLFIFLRYVIGPVAQPFPNRQPGLNMVSDWGWLRCLAGFLLGMLTFELYKKKSCYAILKSNWCFIIFFLATIACMHFGVMDIIIVALFPFIIITAAYNNTRVKKILDTRPLQRIGDWSFSIYMVHMPLIWMFTIPVIYKDPSHFSDINKLFTQQPDYTSGLELCIAVVLLTIIIASLTYRFIEVPARNYFNKVFETKAKKVNAMGVEV